MDLTDREAFDALLDEVDAIDLNEPDTARLLSAIEVALPKVTQALTMSREAPMLSAECCAHAASLCLALASHTKRREDRARAMKWADQGLVFVRDAEAPLLEAVLRYQRGSLLTMEGGFAAAQTEFQRACEILRPHVAAMHALRAHGNQAEIFAAEFVDRRIHAEDVLANAEEGLATVTSVTRKLGALSAALDESEAAKAGRRTREAEEKATATPRGRILESLVVFAVAGAILWCFDAVLLRLIGYAAIALGLANLAYAARDAVDARKQG
jgi:hypothetical protein